MRTIKDDARFEAFQERVLDEVIWDIQGALVNHIQDPAKLKEAITGIAFSVATIFDGSREMHLDHVPVVPFLTFATNDERSEILYTNGGAFMHELAHEAVDAILTES